LDFKASSASFPAFCFAASSVVASESSFAAAVTSRFSGESGADRIFACSIVCASPLERATRMSERSADHCFS
jgi:hypothetical protein